MYIIFSFTNIFEFLIEFNWIELRVIIIWYIYFKKEKNKNIVILCCDPFITYLHIIYKRYLKKQLKKITGIK